MKLGERELRTMDEWRFCPMANYICPTARHTKNEINTPRGLALTAFRMYQQHADPDSIGVKAFYQCSMGGLCATTALDDSDVPALVRALRVHLAQSAFLPASVINVRGLLLARTSLDGSEPGDWSLSGAESRAKTLLVGTPWMSDVHAQEYRAAATLLETAGVECATLPEPVDSGAVLAELGYREEARQALQELVAEVRENRPSIVLFASPHDARVLTSFADELGVEWPADVRWRTALEEVGILVSTGRLAFGSKASGATGLVHPSYVVHELQMKVDPALTEAACENLEELRWSGACTRTCGGASLFLSDRELSKHVVRRSLEELILNREVTQLISSCPFLVLEARSAEFRVPVAGMLSFCAQFTGTRRPDG